MFGSVWRTNGFGNQDGIFTRCRTGPWAAAQRVWRGGFERFGVGTFDGAKPEKGVDGAIEAKPRALRRDEDSRRGSRVALRS